MAEEGEPAPWVKRMAPLVEVAAEQPVFEFENIEGTLAGFFTPEFMSSLSVPGTPTLSPSDIPECISLRDPALIPVDPEAIGGYWLLFTVAVLAPRARHHSPELVLGFASFNNAAFFTLFCFWQFKWNKLLHRWLLR